MRISLITTGDMELLGLAAALKRLFPAHEFHAPIGRLNGIQEKPFDGFTSSTVNLLSNNDPPGKAAKLLGIALGMLKASGEPTPVSDFALILEDVELANIGNESIIVEHVRQSAQLVLESVRPPGDPSEIRRLLRERISFHLAAPMPESWFFGDLAGLATEVSQDRLPPYLSAGRDPEKFLTDDPAYASATETGCPKWIADGRKSARKPYWLKEQREKHPKAYLAWLLRRPEMADCTCYKETKEGMRLLSALDWPTVLAIPGWYPYLRAMIRDLEAALGVAAVGVPVGGDEAPLTSISHLPPDPLLRNI